MDTSEIYIKMCEKSEEIHEAWEPTTSDFVVLRGCKEVNVVGLRDFKEVRVPEDVWLPRQDQLQAMSGIGGWWIQLGKIYQQVNEWHNEYPDYTSYFTSMEQLWLAAIMDWKFNKVWNGEDWVKSN